jgi:iron(III) transport system substrate-binding protein
MNRRRLRALAPLIVGLLAVAACGDDSDSDDDTAAPSTAAPEVDEASDGGSSDSDFQTVISAAEEEGSITIYSSQPLDPLNELAAAFEEEYPGIDVEVVRGTDGELTTRIETEHQTGSITADMWVTSSQGAIDPKGAEGGWFVAPVGPHFEADGYLDEYFHEGDYFEVGAAILTFGWNTDEVPNGLEDFTDLLDPDLAGGRIAVIDANCCPAAVDFYLYLEEVYGEEFVEELAAQEPRIYPSALPIGEALGAGEVAAAAFTLPLVAQQAAGAPVDFAIADQAWGTRFFGALIDGAPHDNAAQVFADFMVSPDGQEIIAANQSSVLPDTPGALTSNDRVREQDLAQLTPEVVAQYQTEWNALFQ